MASPESKSVRSLYIHWPFCLSKCPYCDFNSHVRENIDQQRWRDALIREIEIYIDQFAKVPVDTLFFGGGTPSLMPPETVAAVIDAARNAWGFTDDIEITLEANPTSVEAGNFRDLAGAGVNRVSLGIQALDDSDLEFLGRAHSADEALRALEIAQSSFPRVSFDLIYGRQGQSVESWRHELERATTFGTEHLSLYQLTIEPNTGFAGREKRGEIVMPSDDVQADFLVATEEVTVSAGFECYEISNFAKSDAACRHNLNYWRSGSWIGIGPGAHGRLNRGSDRIATANAKRPETWLQQVEDGHTAVDENRVLGSSEIAAERVMMGLRLSEGIGLGDLEKASGLNREEIFDGQSLERLQAASLIAIDRDCLCVVGAGRLVLDAVLAAILR